ncbi:MAG: Surface layer protein precursor [Firmicutes bacterium ADurb.Bin193]|nr:MAG: Surface layer protein precursor [Firmicutes bacterium ADurb.Bin193]
MKLKSRLLSLILAATLVVGGFVTVGSAATFSDVDETKSYATAVSFLAALKLLKGYDGGTFKPDGDITRTEFAAVIVRALGQEPSATASMGKTQFTDVADDHWGSGYINVASSLGIINGFGDGTFGPEALVTYEQAVKMVVCALGYESLALSKVGNDASKVWPSGYLAAAVQLNIVSGVAGTEGVPAKRWQVARLVYNSLEVDLMVRSVVGGRERFEVKPDKTLLSENLGITVRNGELIANSAESIKSSKARAGEVIIYDNTEEENVTLKDGGISTAGMVGHSVKFYYSEDVEGLKTLIYIEDKTKSSDILIIDADDIEEITGSIENGLKIKYWREDGNSTTTVEVAKNPLISINGRIDSSADVDDLQPLTGSLELIDSERTGKFDRIMVTKYETYVVKSVSTSTKKVIDQYRTTSQDNSITIDTSDSSWDITIKKQSGAEATLSNITQWNVLSIKSTNASSRNTMEVIITSNPVSGSITAVEDEDTIEINNKEYKLSKYFKKYAIGNGAVSELKVDDSGTFYLDKDGKIAAFNKTASAGASYGFLAAVGYESVGLENNGLEFYIVPQTGTSSGATKYHGASRVRIDGTSYKAENVVGEIKDIVNSINTINNDGVDPSIYDEINACYPSMLIKYSLNSSKEVTDIYTLAGDELEQTELGYNVSGDEKTLTYKSSNRQFVGKTEEGKQSKFIIDSKTIVFTVPSDRSQLEKYSRTTGYSKFYSDSKYCVEAYDATGSTNLAKAVVLYGGAVNDDINERSPTAIVESISTANSPDNSDYNRKITAYMFKSGSYNVKVLIWATEADAKNVGAGDVIRFTSFSEETKDINDGDKKPYKMEIYVNEGKLDITVDVSGNIEEVDINYANDNDHFIMFNGYLKSYEDNIAQIALTTDKTKEAIEGADTEEVPVSSSVNVFVYDSEKSASSRFETEGSLDEADSYEDTKEMEPFKADEIVVLKIDGVPRFMYIIRR